MMDRRLLLLGLLTSPAAHAQAQPSGNQGAGQSGGDGALPQRGTPTGRIGGATRGGEAVTLDLVAPERGAGRCAGSNPVLHYRIAGEARRPLRATLSLATQARPLADQALPAPPGPGIHGFTLAPAERLVPGATYVWSVTLAIDPRAPSRDIVASALLVHAPADAALARRVAAAPARERAALWTEAGYFYDAAAAAMEARAEDGGASLTQLLRSVRL